MMMKFLNKTFRYPDGALKKRIQGTVQVNFRVSKEGKIDYIKVVKSVEKPLDEEALRVIQLMPDRKPAIVGGIYPDSCKIQPIVFRLE